jgi:hypothetical protein
VEWEEVVEGLAPFGAGGAVLDVGAEVVIEDAGDGLGGEVDDVA